MYGYKIGYLYIGRECSLSLYSIVYHWLYSNLMVELLEPPSPTCLARSFWSPLSSYWIHLFNYPSIDIYMDFNIERIDLAEATIRTLFVVVGPILSTTIFDGSLLSTTTLYDVGEVLSFSETGTVGGGAWFPLQSHKCLITVLPNSIWASPGTPPFHSTNTQLYTADSASILV